jgi:hypothetical protein
MPALGVYETAQRDLAQAQEARARAQAETDAQAALERAGAAHWPRNRCTLAGPREPGELRDILTYWVRLKEIEQLRSGSEQWRSTPASATGSPRVSRSCNTVSSARRW